MKPEYLKQKSMDNKKLLYQKLNALRLEVDASIVDSIQETVNTIFKDEDDPRCTCGVPNSLHNTCCGWGNANVIMFPWEMTVPMISDEEKEIRWLISQSPNSLRLSHFISGSYLRFISEPPLPPAAKPTLNNFL